MSAHGELKTMQKFFLALACALIPVGSWAADSAPEKVAQVCAACHGEDGNKSATPDTPKLGGQHADYLAKALRDYKSGARKNPIMSAMAGGLSDKEIRELSDWFSRQKSELFVRY
jgi:cytochrome c553